MKTVKIELPDDEADALARAASAGGFASPSDLARVAIEEFLVAPVGYDPDALAREIARHQDEKRRGVTGYTLDEARARLRTRLSD